MEGRTMTMKGLLPSAKTLGDGNSVSIQDEISASLFADEEVLQEDDADDVAIAYDTLDVDIINIPTITDTYGRLSDRVDALEKETGLSVVPLAMANIAPEVQNLNRHEIFEFTGERFAMSAKPRERVVNEWKEKIIANLSSGLTFEEGLITSVTYHGTTYKTLALSKVEWTLLLSMFRAFKQSLVVRNKNNIVMTIKAEHVE